MKEESGEPIVKKKDAKTSIWENIAVDLSKVKYKVFVGVQVLEQLIYTMTSDGHIYIFDRQCELQKWMNIKVERSFGI